MKYLTKHLEEHSISYFEHMRRSLGFGYQSFKAGLIFLIHAFLPFILVEDGSEAIAKLNDNFYKGLDK